MIPMRVAIISLAPLTTDARVLRTVRALASAGHETILIGFGPLPAEPVPGQVHLIEAPKPIAIRSGFIFGASPANFFPASAQLLYWLLRSRRQARGIVARNRPDIIHANDWVTLPIALDAKRRFGSKLVYDTHELAVSEYEESLRWRLLARAHVAAIEKTGIAGADAVIAVSPGIVQRLAELYPEAPPAALVRNVPDARPAPFRPTPAEFTVLFHGLIRPNRGLEPLIASLPLWQKRHRLVIRGSGAGRYIAKLQQLAGSLPGGDRIAFEPAAPPERVVEMASTADLGVISLPDTSSHNRYALPNKLFEYLAAGLGVIVSESTDMAEIVNAYRCGVICEATAPALAGMINALDPGRVDALKQNAVRAAETLTWDSEKQKLLAVYDAIAELPLGKVAEGAS